MRPANSNVLSFETPKKLRSAEKHNAIYQSDSGIAGTYVPNMDKRDMELWKAKHIKGDDERIEIRKTLEGVQLLVVVYKKAYQPKHPKYPSDYNNVCAHGKYAHERTEWMKRHQNIRISMNGKLDMTYDDYWDLSEAIKEAMEILL